MRTALCFAVLAFVLAACGGGGSGGVGAGGNPPGPPAQLAFIAQPTVAAPGVAISPAVTVAIRDAAGQTVTTATDPVTIALGANPGSSTLGGTLTMSPFNGVASFGNLTLSAPGSGYTLTASATGLTGATSSGFDVTAAGTIPNPAPQIANGAWASALTTHPRLLGPTSYLQGLATAQPTYYSQVQANAAHPGYESLFNIMAAGVVHAVTGLTQAQIDPYIADAMANVNLGVTNIHQTTWIRLQNVVLTYDLFYGNITPANRASMITWMNGHLAAFTDDEGCFHNSTPSKILTYLQIAYGTMNDNATAAQFRTKAITTLYEGKLVPVFNQFGDGGGWTEGGWYQRGSLFHMAWANELARRFESYDAWGKAPKFYYQRMAYDTFQRYPTPATAPIGYNNDQFPVEGDGANTYGFHVEYPRIMRAMIAQHWRGSDLARYTANFKRAGSSWAANFYSFLFEETTDPVLSLTNYPLAHAAIKTGKIYARSDWTTNATWFRFEAGDYFSHHQHLDCGNFEIFKANPLATESGEYYDWAGSHVMNWCYRTVAHNCILVNNPAESWPAMRDGGAAGSYANDGGQTKTWSWTTGDLADWNSRQSEFERGNILAYTNTTQYMYVAANCSACYSTAKVSKWIRQIVYIRPSTFVIFDRVVAVNANFQKKWLLHMHNDPVLSGNSATTTWGAGSLKMQSLLPAGAAITKVNGYTYGGSTYDPPVTGLSDANLAHKWRVEITPGSAQGEDLFLTVLSTDASPATATLLTGLPAGQIGLSVGGTEVKFSGDVGGSIKIGATTTPLTQSVVLGAYEK
ncbi:Heparin and heparin-sulfate lyase [Planctomycetaceae bacterium]|nr:Heparin and heparin-sulfate lyase [Planctomycetaceae bacterium]